LASELSSKENIMASEIIYKVTEYIVQIHDCAFGGDSYSTDGGTNTWETTDLGSLPITASIKGDQVKIITYAGDI
jgi:hypothetical protein